MEVECELETNQNGGDQPCLDSKGKKKKKITPNKQNPQCKMTSILFLRKLCLLFKEYFIF